MTRAALRAAAACAALGLAGVGGCSTLHYYGQAIGGELRVLHRRRPIAKVLADPATPLAVRRKLRLVQAARRFASTELHLPRGRSYDTYVALQRAYPVWVVYATREFSLTPHRWCFLFAGCVPYRGYFHEAAARRFAAGLRKRGDDVFVTGAPAYSTLGWFADPVYSSMLRWGKVELAGTIFHELAHQKLYVEGDAPFNESFADAVEALGVERFFSRHDPAALARWHSLQRAQRAAAGYAATARHRLELVYRSGAASAQKRREKGAVFDWLRIQYRALEVRDGVRYSTHWLAELNNATLALLGTYDAWTGAFRRLFTCTGTRFPRFYAAATQLAHMPPKARDERLRALSADKCPATRTGRPYNRRKSDR